MNLHLLQSKHVSVTVTFQTDADPGDVLDGLMDRLGDTAAFVVSNQVHAYDLADAQDYPRAFPNVPGFYQGTRAQ